MNQTTDFRDLLLALRGNDGVSILVDGVEFVNLKVVNVQGNLVFTVENGGRVRSTDITFIRQVDF